MTREDGRSMKVALVAHCILNQNAKVIGLAKFPSAIDEIVDLLRRHEVGLLQMPCPELSFAGLNRWAQTKEQYDTPSFRRHCRKIARDLADQVQEYVRNDVRILAVVGINGSPSCGVDETSVGFKGGRPKGAFSLKVERAPGPGVFVEELRSELAKRGIEVPFVGIKEDRLKESVRLVEEALKRERSLSPR